MTTPNQTAPAKPKPTPWTNARAFFTGCDGKERHPYGDYVDSESARTLERHLRRIVEAWDKSENPYHDVAAAIQAAKEEISK